MLTRFFRSAPNISMLSLSVMALTLSGIISSASANSSRTEAQEGYKPEMLTGTFYDLKMTSKGKPSRMDSQQYMELVNKFSRSWRTKYLEEYARIPGQVHASHFMTPRIRATHAAKAYGIDSSLESPYWLGYYHGEIQSPETGMFRFHGAGDDVLLVRIDGELVIDASHADFTKRYSKWESEDASNRKHGLQQSSQPLCIGDWFKMKKGDPVEIEILIGEGPGGEHSCQLLIEQLGTAYKRVSGTDGTRKVLPIFKTKEIPKELHGQMRINSNEVTLEGPTFGVADQ